MHNEGVAQFEIANVGRAATWYCTYAPLTSSQTRLIVLHGGPGACHEYLLPLRDLYEQHQIPLLFYDQIGNGRSTRLPEKAGDRTFWTVPLFIAELDNLIDNLKIRDQGFDIIGHSWGAMLGSEYAAMKPRGLRKLILASGPASMEAWLTGIDALRLQLPKDVQEDLDDGERTGNFSSPEYEAATEVFYKRHLCRVEPWPAKEVEVALNHMVGDPTVYETLYGVSELVVTGLLKEWSVVSKLHQIEAPTLLLNGKYDEAQDVSMMPFFDNIKQVKWVTLDNSSHFAHVEERKRFIDIVAHFVGA